jgi:hypothetical protein
VGPLSEETCATPASPVVPTGPVIPAGPGTGGPGIMALVPTLDLSGIPKRIRVSRRGSFTLAFTGTPGAKGALTLRSVKRLGPSSPKRIRTLARKSLSASAGGRVKVRLTLSRTYLKALKRAGRLGVRVKVKLGPLTKARRVTLRAPK